MKRRNFIRRTLAAFAGFFFIGKATTAAPKWGEVPPLPDILQGDYLAKIMAHDGLQDFAKKLISLEPLHPLPRKFRALTSSDYKWGQAMTEKEAELFIQNIHYVLEDAVRTNAAIPVAARTLVYDDWLPLRRNAAGVRVSPYISDKENNYGLRVNHEWESAPVECRIPMGADQCVYLEDFKIATIRGDHGWYLRVVFAAQMWG